MRPIRPAGLTGSLLGALAVAVAAIAGAATQGSFGAIDYDRLARAAEQPGEWFTAGGDATGGYYSGLTRINDKNAQQLGFAWEYPLQSTRGQEATPIVVDGTLYTSGTWGTVYALDAATGRERWVYRPDVDTQWARYTCCDAVNRGVAVWKGKVYVAALDGYLHALDAATGRRLWKVDATPGRGAGDFHYFITGAPLIAGDSVVIGNGGADFKGARGSLAAFDLETGKFRWRFYTVPRDPRLGPQDQPHLNAALKTWNAHYDWSTGGGGSVWDGLSYDPRLRLIYFGTANPSPYAIGKDAPSEDALYAASLLAVHADDGALAWYYQEVPGDGWDYDATQKLVLTDLVIGGRSRSVVMQAAKNGYVYVLDRATGELLSARPFTFVNWTRGLDPKTHRPVRNPAADYTLNPALVFPPMTGAHSWQPMSYSPVSRLLYIPVIDAAMVFIETSKRPAGLIEGNFTVAGAMPEDYDAQGMAGLFGALPSLESMKQGIRKEIRTRNVLRAVDPVSGRIVWEQPDAHLWDGGVTSTAGNIVMRGDVAGKFSLYAADTGKLLKVLDVGTSIMAAPTTYEAAGQQYIAVMAGYGGGTLFMPFPRDSAAQKYGNAGRIVAFRLGGGAVPKPAERKDTPFEQPPPREGTQETVAAGERLYTRYCSRCHVFGNGVLPDLRRISAPTHKIFYDIVLRGAYRGKGMPSWDDVLSRADAEAIHAFLVDQAWTAYKGDSGRFTLSGLDERLGATVPDLYVLNGYGCKGGNQSPALKWSGVPAGTRSFALTLFDPDERASPSGWWHWVVYDIPANIGELPVNAGAERGGGLPRGARQGRTDLGNVAYHGPCPDKGDPPHRYVFTLYALNTDRLEVPENPSGAMLNAVLREHLIAQAQLIAHLGR
jgi:quinohemoprotein ethanol dehydrogenase